MGPGVGLHIVLSPEWLGSAQVLESHRPSSNSGFTVLTCCLKPLKVVKTTIFVTNSVSHDCLSVLVNWHLFTILISAPHWAAEGAWQTGVGTLDPPGVRDWEGQCHLVGFFLAVMSGAYGCLSQRVVEFTALLVPQLPSFLPAP